MEINKQLFEDILSGKLKGTFVLRNKQIVKSNALKRSSDAIFPYKILIKYDNGTSDYGTFNSNGDFEFYSTSSFDIVDFIPDTDMKENELTIEIPSDKVVDWDESKKQNKIVLKDKLTYEEICNKLEGMIDISLFDTPSEDGNALVINEHQLECLLAKNKLANIAKYLNAGWKPDTSYDTIKIIVVGPTDDVVVTSIMKGSIASKCGSIWFKSEELAQQAIEILGEETVKLALEPLGI